MQFFTQGPVAEKPYMSVILEYPVFRSWALLLAAAPAPPFKSYAGAGTAAIKSV